ncbi:MAG: tetratricopeptide repeat protein [Candidatus Helarchaeota archaeon]
MSYQFALTEFKSGNYKEAIKKFQKYLNKYPNDPDALFNVGKAHFCLKKFNEAIMYLRSVVELLPNDESAWELMSKIYNNNLGDPERAKLCKAHILPKKPFKSGIIPKVEINLKKKIEKEKRNGLTLPLTIIDANFLIKLYQIKEQNILYVFKQATKLFKFSIPEQMCNDFRKITKYNNRKLFRYIQIEKIEEKKLHDFEKELFKRYPQAKNIKAHYDDANLWYKELSLPYIFLQQNTKKIILISDDLEIHQLCKGMNLNCVCMNAEKFWVYLRYKIRRTFRSFYDMWL